MTIARGVDWGPERGAGDGRRPRPSHPTPLTLARLGGQRDWKWGGGRLSTDGSLPPSLLDGFCRCSFPRPCQGRSAALRFRRSLLVLPRDENRQRDPPPARPPSLLAYFAGPAFPAAQAKLAGPPWLPGKKGGREGGQRGEQPTLFCFAKRQYFSKCIFKIIDEVYLIFSLTYYLFAYINITFILQYPFRESVCI